jgi:hypothetical protein
MTASEPSRPIPGSYWVIPATFLAGEYPGAWDEAGTRRRLGAFLQAGFDTFIDLTRPDELAPYERLLQEEAGDYSIKVVHHRFPIGDFGLPSPEQMLSILDTIESAIHNGSRVYLHCRGGIGRTGTTVGCWLSRHGLAGENALRRLGELYQAAEQSRSSPHSPETEEQREFVLNWIEKEK